MFLSNFSQTYSKLQKFSLLAMVSLLCYVINTIPVFAQSDARQKTGVVVYCIKDIKEGSVISKDDLVEKNLPATKIPSDAIDSASKAISRVARYPISQGQIISNYDLQKRRPGNPRAVTVLTIELEKARADKLKKIAGNSNNMNAFANKLLCESIDTKYSEYNNSADNTPESNSHWYWGTSYGSLEELGFVIQGDIGDEDWKDSNPKRQILFAIIWKAIVPLKVSTEQTKNNRLKSARIGSFNLRSFDFSKRAIYTITKNGKLKEVKLTKGELNKALNMFYTASDTRTSCSFNPLFKKKIIPQLTNFESP